MNLRISSIALFVYGAAVAAFAVLLIALNCRLYSSVHTAAPDLLRQLTWLRNRLDNGAGEEMQRLFPEGSMFTHTLYGLACAETAHALPDTSALRRQMVSEVYRALASVESPGTKNRFPADLSPPYGAFYTVWSSLLRGSALAVTPVAERPP